MRASRSARSPPRGFAVDFQRMGPKGKGDKPAAMKDIAQGIAARHGANLGYNHFGYMGKGRMHADTMTVAGVTFLHGRPSITRRDSLVGDE